MKDAHDVRAETKAFDPGGTSRALRRAEKKPRSLPVALVTEHFWSKIVALLFAGVFVVLIDRELSVVLFEGDLPVRVVAAADAGAGEGRSEMLLLTEDGVAVHRLGAAKVRVVIRGRRKLADFLPRDKGIVGRAYVRRAWLAGFAGGYTSRILEGGEFDVGVPVESVKFELPLQVDFDKEITAELKLDPAFTDVASGLTPSAVFAPPTIKVVGAAAWLAGPGAVARAVVPIACAGRSSGFELDAIEWPEELSRKFLRPGPGPRTRVRVAFAAAEDATITIEGVPLRYAGFQPDLEFLFLPPVEAKKPSVTVVLRGSKDRTAAFGTPEKKEELRRTLLAQIDIDALTRKVGAYLDDPSSAPPTESPEIEVLRLPEGLRLDHTDRVEVSVKRRIP